MDYIYENLGDERFQEFCSCIISKEFPNAQAFPVGQPDGGRDSLVYLMNSPKKEFIVFQVKYVRDPNQNRDMHKWLTKIVEGEADKINKLIPKGAKKYYLLTNVRGTAHLDVGSKDKVNKILEEKIKVPSICWWRDDLSMLFEKDPVFKWSYPEILNGQDILNSGIFSNLTENREKRENVVRAYLADQYVMDNEVKFRQIELQNRMFNLFTDVPFRVKKINEKNKKIRFILKKFAYSFERNLTIEEFSIAEESDKIGIAAFLLNSQVQSEISKVILEGGPGQGKSTISQYVCQVHRARLLNKTCDLELLPDNIKNNPVRLPFKIDLRHIASWVEHKNPYEGILSDDYFTKIWQKSLESFLVGHIYFHSKIEGFNVSEFLSICKLSPILFVFDGFDEIASRNVREDVFDFINKGINRISENCKSMQVIITSRPAALSDVTAFSINTYPHFELADITSATINEYVERWIKASKLDGREASEIRKLVKEKLKMPHIKDLAKTPMQLAILISLLRTRGESLPNKRTSLYDSYIDLFFNRESEKNSIIRDYRDLIIDIHEYLAWVLHSEAELYKNSGIIGVADLKKRLNEYLIREGHQTDITDKLFQVVKERVCALVSRVHGTYEFEVQPLREYFCARYLYKTSPYSPAGAEKTGTLPDRFEAISRNPYWQNVTRFFAGCFSKGELSMLIQKLRELEDDSVLKYTNYPRIITSQLLSDYVFTQYPLILKDVVKIIIDGINIGNIVYQERMSVTNKSIVLPIECGRKELVIQCFKQLRSFPASDYALELTGLIKSNPYKIIEIWSEYLPEIREERLTEWLEYAYKLQIMHKIDENILVDIINSGNSIEAGKRLELIISGNRLDIIKKYPNFKEDVFKLILSSTWKSPIMQRGHFSGLQFLMLVSDPFILARLLISDSSNMTFRDFIYRFFHYRFRGTSEELSLRFNADDAIDDSIDIFAKSIEAVLNSNTSSWLNSIELWDILVENGRKVFGDSWKFINISVIAAGIKSKKEIYEEFSNLSDSSISLCKRARSARMKSGSPKYWEEQLQNNENLRFKLLLLFTWATPKTIVQLFSRLSQIIDSLKRDEVLQLADGIKIVSRSSFFTKMQQDQIIDEINKGSISNTLKFLLSLRFEHRNGIRFICENIDDDFGVFEEITELKLEFLMKKYLSDTNNELVLSQIKNIYNKTKGYSMNLHLYVNQMQDSFMKMPLHIAKKIMVNCKEYPRVITFLAEKTCMINANEHIRSVGEVAKEERWFE